MNQQQDLASAVMNRDRSRSRMRLVTVTVGGTMVPPVGGGWTFVFTTSMQRSFAGTRTVHPLATGKPGSVGTRSAV